MIKVHEFGNNTSASGMEEFIKKEEIMAQDIISFTRFFDSNQGVSLSTLMYFKLDEPDEEGGDDVAIVVDDTTGNVSIA